MSYILDYIKVDDAGKVSGLEKLNDYTIHASDGNGNIIKKVSGDSATALTFFYPQDNLRLAVWILGDEVTRITAIHGTSVKTLALTRNENKEVIINFGECVCN